MSTSGDIQPAGPQHYEDVLQPDDVPKGHLAQGQLSDEEQFESSRLTIFQMCPLYDIIFLTAVDDGSKLFLANYIASDLNALYLLAWFVAAPYISQVVSTVQVVASPPSIPRSMCYLSLTYFILLATLSVV